MSFLLIREAEISIKDFKNETEVARKFTAYYLNGYSKITITSQLPISHDYMKKIVLQVKKVIGFEIVEETDKKIVFQDFFTSNYLSLSKVIRREYNLSRLIIQESKKILHKESKTHDNIHVWEEEIDKLYLLARRQINFALHNSIILNKLELSTKDCQDFLILIGSIEKLSDFFIEITKRCEKIDKMPQKISEQVNRIYDELLDAYDMAFSCAVKTDFALSNKAIEKCKELLKHSITLEKEKPKNSIQKELYMVYSKLQSATSFIEEIAEIGLDKF